jgi:adenylate kinase family enzyme
MTTPQRIHVVGSPGSGKTTLGREIGTRLDIPHIELDVLFWRPEWQQSEIEDFRRRVREALAGEAWVVDGNYSQVRPVVWERVELVVWLDYHLRVCFWRVLMRTFGRVFTGEPLWHGNRETFGRAFLSQDSLLLYVLKTYRRRRRQYGSKSLPN